jgi:hypothetical protein
VKKPLPPFNAGFWDFVRSQIFEKYATNPWSRVHLETLTVAQLVKTLLYGTQRLFTVFTRCRHWSIHGMR